MRKRRVCGGCRIKQKSPGEIRAERIKMNRKQLERLAGKLGMKLEKTDSKFKWIKWMLSGNRKKRHFPTLADVEEWLLFNGGRDVEKRTPGPKKIMTGKIDVPVTGEMEKWLADMAKRENISVACVVRIAIQRYMGKKK